MSAPEGYPQVNKFEQVSSLGHRMSLALGGGDRCEGESTEGGRAMGSLYGKVLCIMAMVTWVHLFQLKRLWIRLSKIHTC